MAYSKNKVKLIADCSYAMPYIIKILDKLPEKQKIKFKITILDEEDYIVTKIRKRSKLMKFLHKIFAWLFKLIRQIERKFS